MSRNERKFRGNKLAIAQTLVTDLADAATLVFNLPTGFSSNSMLLSNRHEMDISGTLLTAPEDFTIAFGATTATITNRTGTTFRTGQAAELRIDVDGDQMAMKDNADTNQRVPLTSTPVTLVKIDIGTPLVADVDGIASEKITTASNATGSFIILTPISSGGFDMDSPTGRNVTVDSDNVGDTTQTIRVTGLDTLGNEVTEDIALSGTTAVAGKKAFSLVLSARSLLTSALPTETPVDTAGVVVIGFGGVFGLTSRLNNEAHQIQDEFLDDTSVVTGTFVVGSLVPETPTSPDVRGTFSPATVANGSNTYTLYMRVVDDTDGGVYKPEDRARINTGSGTS